MHIALVCPYSFARPGGVQEHTRGLARGLVALGHDVTIFAPEAVEAAPKGEPHVISLGAAFDVRSNESVAPVGRDPRMLVRFDLGLDPMDVLHVQEPALPASLAAVFRSPKLMPIIGTFHAAGGRNRLYEVAAPLVRRASKRFAATIAVSPIAREYAVRHVQVDPVVIANGVDVDALANATPDEWAASLGRVVLFLGRNDRRKGFDVAVDAFRRLDDPDVHFVATAPPGSAAGRNIHCVGMVDSHRKRALLRAAEVVCLPASGGESFGVVVAEAMAAGAAVVAGDNAGYRCAGGDAPVYVPARDVASIASALRLLLADEALRADCIDRGRARVRQFDWSVIAAQTAELYAKC